MMGSVRLNNSFASLVAFWFAAAMVPLVTGCDSGRPPTVAPAVPAPVDTEQFAEAKLTFKDEVIKDGRLVLEKGKEYEYSGSFRLTQVDDEAAEYQEYVRRIQNTLRLTFIIDGIESGYELTENPSTGKLNREMVAGSKQVQHSRVDASSNTVHFEGRLKAPMEVGEQELQLTILPLDSEKVTYIATRPVRIVEPAAPSGD